MFQELGTFLLGAGMFINAAVALASIVLQWVNAQKSDQRAKAIVKLAANTDGMKDALLKITADSEHAKGVLVGREEILNEKVAGP